MSELRTIVQLPVSARQTRDLTPEDIAYLLAMWSARAEALGGRVEPSRALLVRLPGRKP